MTTSAPRRLLFLALAAFAANAVVGRVFAEVIQPVAAEATTTFTDPISGNLVSPPENLINGSGLDGVGPVQSQGHDTGAGIWLSNNASVAAEQLTFDLGGIYNLTTSLVWQGNDPAFLDRGVRNFDILVSSEPAAAGNFTLVGSRNLAIGGGLDGETAQSVATAASNVRAVKFDIQSTWSGLPTEFVNLSEVRFDGTFVHDATLKLSIDRVTGAATITNNTTASQAITDLSITSASALALDASRWISIAGNYDEAANGGNGSVDPNDTWVVSSATPAELSEGTAGDATIVDPQTINLSNSGLWVRQPVEDVLLSYTLAGSGIVETVAAEFTGGLGMPYPFGDLDFDGDVDLTDFQNELVPNLFGPTLVVSVPAQSYASGDLDGDLEVGLSDFLLFKAAYAEQNPGAPALTLAQVPEPATSVLWLLGFSGLLLALARRRPARAAARWRRRSASAAVRVAALTAVVASMVAAASAEVITPSKVIGTSEFGFGIEVERLIDGSGLDGIGNIQDQLHTNQNSTNTQLTMWHAGDISAGIPGGESTDGDGFTPPVVSEQILEFELPRHYAVNSAIIWQYNELNPFGGGFPFGFRGVNEFKVKVARTLTGPFATLGTYNLAEAVDPLTPEAAQVIPLDDNATGTLGVVRRVRFEIFSAHSGEFEEFVGLSEVRFEGEMVGDVAMRLMVNSLTGEAAVENGMVVTQDIDGYSIESAAGALDTSPTGWDSFDDQGLDVVGPGVGESWLEGGGSDAQSLGEVFLLGSS